MVSERDRPTPEQLGYVAILKKKLHFPDDIYDQWCIQMFGRAGDRMTKRDVSRALDLMTNWEILPADVQRMKGQLDLFSMG